MKEEPQEIELHKEKISGLEQQKEEVREPNGTKSSSLSFYPKSGCVSKLCTRRDVLKDAAVKIEDKDSPHGRKNRSHVVSNTGMSSSPHHGTPEPPAAATPSMVTTNDTTSIPPPATTSLSFPGLLAPRESPGNTPPTSSPSLLLSFQASDQLLRVLTERSGHWFSLLPRNPCDLSSLTVIPPGVPRGSPQASSTPGRPRSPPPSPALPLTPSAASASTSPHHPAGLLNYPLSTLQVRPCHTETPSLLWQC